MGKSTSLIVACIVVALIILIFYLAKILKNNVSHKPFFIKVTKNRKCSSPFTLYKRDTNDTGTSLSEQRLSKD